MVGVGLRAHMLTYPTHWPAARQYASFSTSRRAQASISPSAMSAVAPESTSGVLPTATCTRVAGIASLNLPAEGALAPLACSSRKGGRVFVGVCLFACVRVSARACVCVCVRVC